MRVALIGGTGFIGSYLVDALLEHGHEPALLVRPGSEGKVRHADDCRLESGEVQDDAALARLLAPADAVIYNIGILREEPERGITFEALHYRGAKHAMDAAHRSGVGRFLLMSANGVAPRGTAYQRSKYRAEEALIASGLDYTIFRPSVVFGDPRGRDEIATRLCRELIRPPLPAPWFHTGFWPAADSVRLSPVHVGDVAQAFVAALEEPATSGRTLRLGGPEALSWKMLLERIANAVGKRKLMLPMPIPLMSGVAAIFDRWPWFPVTRDQLLMLAAGNIAPADTLRDLLRRELRAFAAPSLDYLPRSCVTD